MTTAVSSPIVRPQVATAPVTGLGSVLQAIGAGAVDGVRAARVFRSAHREASFRDF